MAFYHVTPKRELFTSYEVGKFGKVKMGNDSHVNIIEIDNIYLRTDVGCILTLKNVHHVPDIRLDLLSTHVFDIARYES